MDFGIKVPGFISDNAARESIGRLFEKYGIHSNYIINYWPTFCIIAIVFGIAIVSWITTILAEKAKKGKVFSLMVQITAVFKWNFCLLIFCGNMDQVIIFSALFFSSSGLDSGINVASFLFSLVCIGYAIYTLTQSIYIVYKYQKLKSEDLEEFEKNKKLQAFSRKWDNYQVMYKGYKENSITHQAFMFFYTLRMILFSLAIVCIPDQPLAQAILITLLSVMILAYIIKIRSPIKLVNFL